MFKLSFHQPLSTQWSPDQQHPLTQECVKYRVSGPIQTYRTRICILARSQVIPMYIKVYEALSYPT